MRAAQRRVRVDERTTGGSGSSSPWFSWVYFSASVNLKYVFIAGKTTDERDCYYSLQIKHSGAVPLIKIKEKTS